MSDILITDYSSVYFDYLLLNKPIIFTVQDIEKYKSQFGFSFDNPLEFMPGPKVNNKDELLLEINKFINNNSYYEAERILVNNKINEFNDFNSNERLFDAITNILNKKRKRKI